MSSASMASMSSMSSAPKIEVSSSAVRAVAVAAKDLKEVRVKLGDLDKQIKDEVAEIQRAIHALYGQIDSADAFGAPEGTLVDAEAREEKLYKLKKSRDEMTSQEYTLTRQLRAARRELRKVPFGELLSVVRSEKSTEEEYEAAEAEMRRREELCLAIRHILGGKYWMPHKDRKYSAYVGLSSAAEDVRNEPVVDIASFAFSEEDAKTIGKVVCDMLGRPDSDGGDVALTELCGLSEKYGPQFVTLADYQKLMVEDQAKVDAIIGTALKAKLHSVDPVQWDFWADSENSADSAGREAKSARLTEPTGSGV